jgi:murein DD-endopeptidase MepM/ murein hydrolase activator NlpD
VRDGLTVRAGQVVGAVGNTGSAAGTPPHLHIAWEHLGTEGWVNTNPFFLLRATNPRKAATEPDPSPSGQPGNG